MKNPPIRRGSVSYTHLDVYKRQEYIKFIDNGTKYPFGDYRLSFDGFNMKRDMHYDGYQLKDGRPVSYTHLEVYKRQNVFN